MSFRTQKAAGPPLIAGPADSFRDGEFSADHRSLDGTLGGGGRYRYSYAKNVDFYIFEEYYIYKKDKGSGNMMEWEKLLSTDKLGVEETEPKDWESYPINAFEKDYNKIVSSAAFRRLQDKTQVSAARDISGSLCI